MRKFFTVLSLTLGLLMCSTTFVACSSDDDSDNSSGDKDSTERTDHNNQPQKHIAKIIEEEGGSIYESTFTYDSQGRVVKIVESESSVGGVNSSSEKTYQYGETLIITKRDEKGTYSGGQTFNRIESHAFTLNNGLIVKDEEEQTNINSAKGITTTNTSKSTEIYAYNADYLFSINSNEVKWTDGNITNIGNKTFTYSNVLWIKGFPFYLKGSNMDSYLFAMGYYGIIPKYLPSQYSSSETSGSRYDYTLQDNLVIKVVATPFVEDGKHNKTTSTIVWE